MILEHIDTKIARLKKVTYIIFVLQRRNHMSVNYYYSNEEFGLRLAKLRTKKGVTAREMSLEIGQNKNYISSIEAGKNYPTMYNFFLICEYLKISPDSFFGPPDYLPILQHEFFEIMEQIPEESFEHLYHFLQSFLEHKN